MKITRYLWINNLPKNCDEDVIQTTFQSHGKIQTIRIHENNNSRGAIVSFIDCKSSTKAYDSVKTLHSRPLKLEYCEANGEPGINDLGSVSDGSKNNRCNKKSGSRSSRSSSSSSNTSSFGSSLDDCSKYPTIQCTKRIDNNNDVDDDLDKISNTSDAIKSTDKECLNSDYRGLLVENLSQRSSDTSLREGLFHEYKKHGKITSVAVMGQGAGRHAIISFKRSEDMEKAFDVSQGKTFFGNQIQVKRHNGYNYIDPDLCPPEHAMDEYHPKATKTLFIGKLATGSVTELDLKKIFKKYGDIIDIDIKTQSNQVDTSFAFVQYYDISSVVRALRNQDSIKVDGKSVKLGFGKSQPANCLWIGNLQRNANESFLRRHFKRFGTILLVIPDPEYSCALIQFEGAEDALRAFTDTRERCNNNSNKRMQVDYASNEYQMAFMNRLKKSCQFDSQDFLKNIADPYQTEKLQNLLLSYTKYLGLLDETRNHSYDRYDPKSDYEEYDELYGSHPSRQRKSVHQRLYNDSYGVDDEYSDEYHYSKPKSRHYDEYSSSRSPMRYSRSNQKYAGSENYSSRDSRRSNYQRYNHDYYDNKAETSSNAYYPRFSSRSPDTCYNHSNNHNRSYSPSPTSSVDYCDDYPRYNLSPRRYSRSNKEHKPTSRSRKVDLHEPHFDRTWTKTTKSSSKTKIADSVSPSVKISSRTVRNELTKKNRIQKSSGNETLGPKSSSSMNLKSMISTVIEPTKSHLENVSIPSVVQPVDALSKLERERAKLLAELSLLSEDTSVNKVAKPAEAMKPRKKTVEAAGSINKSSDKKLIKIEDAIPKVETTISEDKLKIKDSVDQDKILVVEALTLTSSKEEKQLNNEVDLTVGVKINPIITPELSASSKSRDPRLYSPTFQARLLLNNPLSANVDLPVSDSVVTPPFTGHSYKESTSDSDQDQFSHLDQEVEKRIRELDAKMNRSEQSIRTLDYSKFRIKKKGTDNTMTTSPSSMMMSPISSLVTTASLLDVGYTNTSRDTSSTTSDFIKTMLNQTKQKTYNILSETNSNHLTSLTSTASSALAFRTIDLGANDIERRSLVSRFGSTTANSLSFVDSKLNVDTTILSPTISSYQTRLPTQTVVSPITTRKLSTVPMTSPTISDSNQPMKSILKKSNAPLCTPQSTISRTKSSQDLTFFNENKSVPTKPLTNLKRKQKSEPEESDCRQPIKKFRNEYGPILDDTLFKICTTKPIKKPKKSLKRLEVVIPPVEKKGILYESKEKSIMKGNKKSKSKLPALNKPKLKSKSAVRLKKSQLRKGKSKSVRKLTKRKKDEMDEDGDNSESQDNEHFESMYDKIKRRNTKASRRNGGKKGKKRRTKQILDVADVSSDNLNSDDSEYWSVKSTKRLLHQKRKRPRQSDVNSSSGSNYSKTTPLSKSHEPQLTHIRTNEDNVKDEPITDESKAPAESFNLSSPHNSSQCSSPKSHNKDPFESISSVASSNRSKSLHRPNDGPLKKRPITEPILLLEDLPFLEKQAEDGCVVTSPRSVNDEPPSQLESVFDIPSSHVTEEVVIDDQHHSVADIGPMEYNVVPADVNSASHILLTMKSQPTIDIEYQTAVLNVASDQQLQSVAEHLISLAHNSLSPSMSDQSEDTKPRLDDEVTTYVKNIIDRIKHEHDATTTVNKENATLKRTKKPNSFNVPFTKSISVVNQECHPLVSIEKETINQMPTATITTISQPLTLATVTSSCVLVTTGQTSNSITQSDETVSTSSTDKRTRHTSGKSDPQMQSLDETIDSVVRSSLSSSVSDAVSVKSVTDVDISLDDTKSITNSYESGVVPKYDLASLDETINEVINKLSVNKTSLQTKSLSTAVACVTKQSLLNDAGKPKDKVVNHIKHPMYQLTGNVGGIANLVLGIPSILTVNAIVSQQNSLNHMINFSTSVSGQNLMPLTSLQSNSVSSTSSQILTSANISLQSVTQHTQNAQTNDMVFTKLNSLTPIMIQAPLRNMTPVIRSGTNMTNIHPGPTFVNKSITTPVNLVPRSQVTPTHGLNIAKISASSLDSNYLLMMQRQQICQSNSTVPNQCHSVSNHVGPSIILSQLANNNSVFSPVTPGVLTTSASTPTQSMLFRPLNIPFPKFEEKDDWLKQNALTEWNYPIRWTGKLCLKNDEVFVQMHTLAGNENLIRNSMNLISPGQVLSPPLRIVQRMRLEPNQLEGLQRRLTRPVEFCTCLTLAGGDKADELGRTSTVLSDNFIKYLQEKSAAGIINIAMPDSQQNTFVIHIFPPCEFSDNQLRTCSATLYQKLKENAVPYLIIVITTV